LRKAFGDWFENLELVEADLLDADSISRAVVGSTYVVHTASPVVFNPKTDDDVIKPAVDGTLAVMKACTASGVKRVVVTSSMAAVVAMAATDKPDVATGFYDETCWSNPDRPEGLGVYHRSKTLAEKLAWDYVRDTDKNLELVTIQPTLVLGPALIPGGFPSAQSVLNYFNPDRTEVPVGHIGMVDVRDVSKIHLESIRRPDAAGNRFIAYSERAVYHETA
jgi:nucleoside-diphosphate-sugar epimerase